MSIDSERILLRLLVLGRCCEKRDSVGRKLLAEDSVNMAQVMRNEVTQNNELLQIRLEHDGKRGDVYRPREHAEKIFRWSELCDDVRVILISSRNLNFDSLDYKPAADEKSRKC